MSHVTDITKTSSSRWGDRDLKHFQSILGYANFGRPNMQQLNTQLHDYQKESKPDNTQHVSERSSHDSLITKKQEGKARSSDAAFALVSEFLSTLQGMAQPVIAIVIILVIGIALYYPSVMESMSLQEATEYIESGRDINHLQVDGKPLLHTASGDGYIQVTSYLLEHGANINSVDITGWTALHHAVAANDVEMVEFLLAAGADSSRGAGMKNITPMWIASQNDYREIIQAIYDAK